MAETGGAPTGAPTPAALAATVRDGIWGSEPNAADTALDALLAQAENAARTLELSDEDHDIVVAHLEAKRHAAVRAAEQAQDALRQIGKVFSIVEAKKIARAALTGDVKTS